MWFGRLGGNASTASPLASFLGLDDVFALALGSTDCRTVCRLAVRKLDLQAFPGDPRAALLRLTGHSLTDHGAAIREINAAFCRPVDDATLNALPELPALQVLNLDGCQEVSDEGLLSVAKRCKNLRSFSSYWNVKVTDVGLCRVLRAQKGNTLQFLSFSGCKRLSDETVQRVATSAMQLEVLDLTRCNKVTDFGVQMAFEYLSQLKVLRLYAMAQLSPRAFRLLPRMVHLEELDLCGCRVEDGPLVEMLNASAPSKLHTLNLTWCPALTDASVLAIASACPRTVWLSVFGNTNITSAAIESLAASVCGQVVHSLDVRGLTRAQEYSANSQALKKIFPKLVYTDLHH